MSMSAFHYIHTQLLNYIENLRIIKDLEEAKQVGRRTHVALKAYQELLCTLDFMSKSQDEQIRQSAKVIQSNVFYVFEYRDIFVNMLRNFKESKCSRSYLRDLVEAAHIFLKMLEASSKSSKLVVQKKKGKKKKKAKKQPARNDANVEEPSEEQLVELWEGHASSEIVTILQGHPELPEGLSPFD
uniref:AP180 N-terminal homology (ANTH) domain-containing protein n=1 Tax=Biomphalaria glabrata TaxID=6526 RepID=A0A2C9KYB4_BIOGL